MDASHLGIAWQLGSYSGWGVYGLQIALGALRSGVLDPVPFEDLDSVDAESVDGEALRRLDGNRRVVSGAVADALAGRGVVRTGFSVLHGLGNRFVTAPLGAVLHGRPDIGVVFLEDTAFDTAALDRARRYERIVAGSSWNGEVLRGAGIGNVLVQPQGVDLAVFQPAPPSGALTDRFVVFSGGKLEYRKGQDITVEAFRRFHARHPDSLLLAAWYNPWPQLMEGIARSPWVTGAPAVDERGRVHLSSWLRAQGLPDGAFRLVNPMPNRDMAAVMCEADVALFPNRCEGGTNMVAMECLACGVATILSANTGHLDLVRSVPCWALKRQGPVDPEAPEQGVEGWGESDVDEILAHLERAYADRASARDIGRRAAAEMRAHWGWERQIGCLFDGLGLPGGAKQSP
ncbi:glycosyltransferase family 4 protein [Azospirillum sp. sgz301742]